MLDKEKQENRDHYQAEHPRVNIRLGERSASVDQLMSETILAVWAHDIDTFMSCQEQHPNEANITFLDPEAAWQFYELVNQDGMAEVPMVPQRVGEVITRNVLEELRAGGPEMFGSGRNNWRHGYVSLYREDGSVIPDADEIDHDGQQVTARFNPEVQDLTGVVFPTNAIPEVTRRLRAGLPQEQARQVGDLGMFHRILGV